jgi:hypothetical protein
MSNDVSEQRAEYKELLPYQLANRAAVIGQRAIRKGGTKYLTPLASMLCTTKYDNNINQSVTTYSPILTAKGQAEYNKYLDNAYFYGASGRTVMGLSGLIFAKPPVAVLPNQIDYMADNVDGKGKSLNDFTSEIVSDAFQSVWSGVLVARPETPEGASEADVEAGNLRPKLLHYKFESIINWDYETVNNQEVLSLLVLVDATTKRDGFKVETEKQYRVLELIDGVYHQSLYNKNKELITPSAPVIINGATSSEIPFYWIQAGEGSKAVIDDLVDANFQHYNIYADYGSKLHYSSFIIYYETGVNGESANMVVGNGVKWNGGSESSFGVLQPDGNADSHRLALQDTELRMAALGAEMLKPRTGGAESAEAKGLDQVAQNSTTANVANTVSSVITRACNFASRWMGGTEDAVYSLNVDYNPTGMDPQMIAAQLALLQSDQISEQTLYENLQKGEVANTERTLDEEKTLIGAQGNGLGNDE